MLSGVRSEATQRLAAAKSMLRLIFAHEEANGHRGGDQASRSGKGLIFIQNYAVYEFVVVQSVRSLIISLNTKLLPLSRTRPQLLALALDSEFDSVINGSLKKTWDARSKLLLKSHSSEPVLIHETKFPKDGSHFRVEQLETIWKLFGIPDSPLPSPRLNAHIIEMVDTRNGIAHGTDAPDSVGGRFSVADLEKRINDTELLCTHLISKISEYIATASAFQ